MLGVLAIWLAVSVRRSVSPGTGNFYVGRLADGRRATFTLVFEKTNVTCWLHLEGSAYFPLLAGPLLPHSKTVVVLNEAYQPEYGVSELRGVVSQKDDLFSGVLNGSNFPNGLSFTSTNVAKAEILEHESRFTLQQLGGTTRVRAIWPVYLNRDSFFAKLSQNFKSKILADTQLFLASRSESYSQRGFWNVLKYGNANYSRRQYSSISYISSQLVSVYQEVDEYTGGAHLNTYIAGHNFLSKKSELNELDLSDFFLPQSDWKTMLCKICKEDLSGQGASDFADESTNQLTMANLTVFTFDGRGLAFHFEPYAVGSYVQGSFHVFIPWTKLRPVLNERGPLRLMAEESTNGVGHFFN